MRFLMRLHLLNVQSRKYACTQVKIFMIFLMLCGCAISEMRTFSELGYGKGSYCTEDADCDQTRYLKCIENSCECKKEIGSRWIPEQNSCMLKAGSLCGNTEDEPRCITNSFCNGGLCECDYEFLESETGVCELSYGYDCSGSMKCASQFMLECVKTSSYGQLKCKCQGDGIEYVWDDDKQKCVSVVGGLCDTDEDHVYKRKDRLECIKNAECDSITGRCKCTKGFEATVEGNCMLQYGEKCDRDYGPKCNRFSHLHCEEGLCKCQYSGQSYYDAETRQCRFYIDSDCHLKNENNFPKNGNALSRSAGLPDCPKNAYCKTRAGVHAGRCACMPGFEASSLETCTKDRGHGLPCDFNSDCDSSGFLECIFNDEMLGYCDCLQNQMYFDGKNCRVKPGRSCAQNKLCATNSNCDGEWCVCDEGHYLHGGNCVINNRKGETMQKTTLKSSNTTSSPKVGFESNHPNYNSEGSYDFGEITTPWKKFLCEKQVGSHIWLPQKNRCVGLVGTACEDDEDCIPNGVCDSHLHICQCVAMVAYTTQNRTCMTPLNHSVHNPHVRSWKETQTMKSVNQDMIGSSSKEGQTRDVSGIKLVFTMIEVIIIQYWLV